jgi:inosine-uridine nucleoside N-ribohydrolase
MRAVLTAALLPLLLLSAGAHAQSRQPSPVILDTDIGTDIDDAYALAALIGHGDLELLGVTTVSSDAAARARLAAKLLHVAGGKWSSIPVYAGISTPTQYMKQVEWAAGFTAPNLHESGGVEFLRREINARPGKITLIAVGELTNVAALLESDAAIAKKIRAISLMGGSIYRGYAPGSKPEPEWNIKSNAKAAKVVFESGVPLLVAPLDSTATSADARAARADIRAGTPLNDALASLDQIWRYTNHWKGNDPTLFDVLAVELVVPRTEFPLTALRIDVAPDGLTSPVQGGKPNAQVALNVDVAKFMKDFVARLAGD